MKIGPPKTNFLNFFEIIIQNGGSLTPSWKSEKIDFKIQEAIFWAVLLHTDTPISCRSFNARNAKKYQQMAPQKQKFSYQNFETWGTCGFCNFLKFLSIIWKTTKYTIFCHLAPLQKIQDGVCRTPYWNGDYTRF